MAERLPLEHCYRCAIGQHDKCVTGLCSHTRAADRWIPCVCEVSHSGSNARSESTPERKP